MSRLLIDLRIISNSPIALPLVLASWETKTRGPGLTTNATCSQLQFYGRTRANFSRPRQTIDRPSTFSTTRCGQGKCTNDLQRHYEFTIAVKYPVPIGELTPEKMEARGTKLPCTQMEEREQEGLEFALAYCTLIAPFRISTRSFSITIEH